VFRINVEKNGGQHVITLVGMLNAAAYKDYREALMGIPSHAAVRIVSSGVEATPEGVSAWIQTVNQYVANCKVVYAPSKFSTMVQARLATHTHPPADFESTSLAV